MRISEQQVYDLFQIAQESLRVEDLDGIFASEYGERSQLIQKIKAQQNDVIMDIGESSVSSELDNIQEGILLSQGALLLKNWGKFFEDCDNLSEGVKKDIGESTTDFLKKYDLFIQNKKV